MSVRVTQAVAEVVVVKTPAARVTQYVAEVVTAKSPAARVTQYVVEVVKGALVPSDITIAMGHIVATSQAIGRELISVKTVNQTITTTTLAHAPAEVPVTVAQTITVSPLITARSTVIHKTVTSTVGASQLPTNSGAVSRSVSASVTISQEITTRGRTIAITVTSQISIDSEPHGRSTVVRLSINENIATDVDDGAAWNNLNRQTLGELVVVEDDFIGRSTRDDVVSEIIVSAAVSFLNSVQRRKFENIIPVGQTIKAWNLHVRMTQPISVLPLALGRATNIRILVYDDIEVDDRGFPRKTPVDLTVADEIEIPQYHSESPPIRWWLSNVKLTMEDALRTTIAITASPNPARVKVDQVVLVDSRGASQYVNARIAHSISVSEYLVAGGFDKEAIVSDSIKVTDDNSSRKTPIKITVRDVISAKNESEGRGPIVEVKMNQMVRVSGLPRRRLVPSIFISDRIEIHPLVRLTEWRYTFSDIVTVGSNPRQTPVSLQVDQLVTLDERSQTIWMIMRDFIGVGSTFWNNQDLSETQTLPIIQQLDSQFTKKPSFEDHLELTESLQTQVEWSRSFLDTLPIPEIEYPKKYNFWPYPISVPVFYGRLMSNLVVLESGSTAITLPAALLGDSRNNADKIQVQRSMNAKTMTIISRSDRERLILQFRISLRKSYELRDFVQENQSKLIKLTDWNGAIWLGRFMSNPYSHTHAGHSLTEQEYVKVEIEFEGAKVAG